MTPDNGKTSPATAAQPHRAPHDLDAERAVLGAILLDNSVIPDVTQTLKPADFYHTAHQVIYQAMLDLVAGAQPVEPTLLIDQLRRNGKLEEAGGFLAIAGLEQYVLATGGTVHLAEVVKNKATYRRLMLVAQQILDDCSQEKRDVDLQLDVAENLIFDISQQATPRNFVPIGDLMPPAIEEIGQLQHNKGEITGQRTHFRDLDGLLNGLHKSDLLVLAARPSIGKTAFVLNIMLNIAFQSRVPVGIFSLEMGREQLNMRLLAMHAGIPSYKIRRGMLTDNDFAVLREKATDLQDVPVYIDDTPGLSLLQVRSQARRFASQQKNLGLLVVDYLQLMSGSGTGSRDQNRQQEVSEISRGLKALARDLQVPVIALSQLSRNIEQRGSKKEPAKPMLSDLRESGAIEQDADIVLFLHRERRDTELKDDGTPVDRSLPVETEVIVGKHRNGPIGTVEMLFWPDFMRFTDKAR
jgi:replicative DNA helicase